MSVHPDPVQFVETQSELTCDLIAARALIERGWTQGASARDANGFDCAVGPGAATFCIAGAIQCATRQTYGGYDAIGVMGKLLQQSGYDYNITFWNDEPTRRKEDVLAFFDKAILESMKGAN